jgi:hypothetical protein
MSKIETFTINNNINPTGKFNVPIGQNLNNINSRSLSPYPGSLAYDSISQTLYVGTVSGIWVPVLSSQSILLTILPSTSAIDNRGNILQTLQIEDANINFGGIINVGNQSFSGTKTFTSAIETPGITNTGGTLSIGNGATLINFNNIETSKFLGGQNNNVSIGLLANNALTTGTNNISIGNNANLINMTGNDNIAIGLNTLSSTQISGLLAIGSGALQNNTTGINNLAIGYQALNLHTTGNYAVAIGYQALSVNTTGSFIVAVGNQSLQENTTGIQNTALGHASLFVNTTGSINTAIGNDTLGSNITGGNNIAVGSAALHNNISGNQNVAMGVNALQHSLGNNNTAIGFMTLVAQINADNNTALGFQAGENITGSNNILIGSNAGIAIINTNDNIDIGNSGIVGDSGIIRIGTTGTQLKNFQAAIRGITTDVADAIPILISSTGQLGTLSSLRSKKENIIDLDENTNSLIINRLITRRFDFIDKKGKYQQYGMIVDEVIDICPDIIANNSEGEPETIMYQYIPIMILKEIQRMNSIIQTQMQYIQKINQITELQTLEILKLKNKLSI